ncbi:MAG: protein kinase [Polyangiaceae bacterium]|nr:protein kinase [Polyangiaceae bacterium]
MAHTSPKKPFLRAADPAELAPGTLIDGRYRVIRVIGVGGTGIVYEVEHDRTGQRLALKTLLDQAQAPRLEQEARALARLRSPHVVKVVELGQCDAGPFMAMTLLVGRNLRDVLESKVRLPLSFVANLLVQVAEGLDEAHRVGLVHRDLKPDNIHLADPVDADTETTAPAPASGPDGKPPHDLTFVTVFDFGVVKMSAAELNNPLTRTGSTVGTPYYMSLEQLRGAGTVDAQSDVYALCVMLYECLAGQRPFEAGTLGDLIFAICSINPAHLSTLRPDIPREVADVVMRGLSREKKERPQTMRDLARAFSPFADPSFTMWLRVGETGGPSKPAPAGPVSGPRPTASSPSTPMPAEAKAPPASPSSAGKLSQLPHPQAVSGAPLAQPVSAAPPAQSVSGAPPAQSVSGAPPAQPVPPPKPSQPSMQTGAPPASGSDPRAGARAPNASLPRPLPPPRPTTRLVPPTTSGSPSNAPPASPVSPPANLRATVPLGAARPLIPSAQPSTSGTSAPAVASMIDDEESSTSTGERETPTEMYMPKLHGELGELVAGEDTAQGSAAPNDVSSTAPPPANVSDGSVPTMSLPAELLLPKIMPGATGPLGADTGGVPPPPQSFSGSLGPLSANEDKTAILDMAALQKNPPNPSPQLGAWGAQGSQAPYSAPPPSSHLPTTALPQVGPLGNQPDFAKMTSRIEFPTSSSQPAIRPATPSTPSHAADIGSGVRPQGTFTQSGAHAPVNPMVPGGDAQKPKWEQLLVQFGDKVNELVNQGVLKFRQASQELQIVVVMIGTASLAVIIVFLIWAIWLS